MIELKIKQKKKTKGETKNTKVARIRVPGHLSSSYASTKSSNIMDEYTLNRFTLEYLHLSTAIHAQASLEMPSSLSMPRSDEEISVGSH